MCGVTAQSVLTSASGPRHEEGHSSENKRNKTKPVPQYYLSKYTTA